MKLHDYLPDEITEKGITYLPVIGGHLDGEPFLTVPDITQNGWSDGMLEATERRLIADEAKRRGLKHRTINVLAKNLRGQRDLRGRPYKPQKYVFVQLPPLEDRLFAGVMPAGITYCDRKIEVDGDYKKIAFLAFYDLKLQIFDKESRLLPLILPDAKRLQRKVGEEYQISLTGQTIILGSGLCNSDTSQKRDTGSPSNANRCAGGVGSGHGGQPTSAPRTAS
jgi:hypothetical protein